MQYPSTGIKNKLGSGVRGLLDPDSYFWEDPDKTNTF